MTSLVQLRLDAVGHRYGARRVFQAVSLSVDAGEVAAITGHNGSGKSTLMRIAAGLLQPTDGAARVLVNGSALAPGSYRRAIGYVAPDLMLYRELTGAENLQFFARLHGLSLQRDDLIARLTEVGLRGRGRDLVATYSSGMRQRLKYAWALLVRPPVLLLDEPTANLDEHGAAIVREIVARQRVRPHGGITVIATNETEEVAWADAGRVFHLG